MAMDITDPGHVAMVTEKANAYARATVEAIRAAMQPVNGSGSLGVIARESTLAILSDVERIAARAYVVGYGEACAVMVETEGLRNG